MENEKKLYTGHIVQVNGGAIAKHREWGYENGTLVEAITAIQAECENDPNVTKCSNCQVVMIFESAERAVVGTRNGETCESCSECDF